ncbi:ABC transporter ATP-binding protein [Rhizobium halophytocola]|uniref:Iron complex transport system ATP-binding protein n=1 Tax=Rhizobium halophytocola TaxID=735519 RepID=A0ABS4E270_9HYPH|nr:ABC transporter ATP-binding protein [Rhizobium halophytocola]MBP1852013.1 iron complex transport system ATP-binding protein [Rhizobium halophytocola]
MLKTEGLTLGFGTKVVIDDLSLELPEGRMTAILGPNGCGKSTLLRALARLMPPMRGTVRLGDDDIHAMDTRRLARQLAILPQSPRAPEGITVRDLVRRGRTPWRGLLAAWSQADAEACARALDAVGLQALSDRPIDALSGGQRQRAWIALVLAQNTPLLLLDEPTTWLDLKHQLEVLSLLQARNRDTGATVVTVLHDLNLAARFFDHLVLMGPQGLVAVGSPDTVLTEANLLVAFGLAVMIVADPVTGTPMIVPR